MMNNFFLNINENIKISYLDNQKIEKKILLFVHGWGADKYNLQSIYFYLKDDFRIISIDLPGFGESSSPDSLFGSGEFSEIVYQFLKKMNILEINYIGHSFGGKIGILLASKYPDLIKRLVLIDSSGIRSRRNLGWHLRVGYFKTLKMIYSSITKDKSKIEKFKKKFGSEDYRTAGNLRDILVKITNEDFTDILEKIICPVFLYWGDKDKDTPLWMAKKMLKKIKDSGIFIVKKGGHFSFLDDNRIISIIRSFVC